MEILKVVVFSTWDAEPQTGTFMGMNGKILNAVDRIEFDHYQRHVLFEKHCKSQDNFFALPDEERKKRLKEMLSPTPTAEPKRKKTV